MPKRSAWIIVVLMVISLVMATPGCVSAPPEEDSLPGETIPPETEAEVLFSENFESGAQNWSLEEGWSLQRIDSNTVLKGEGHKWATLEDKSWDNYAFNVRFKLIQGTIQFSYRRSMTDGHHRYFIGVSSENLYLNKQVGGEFYSLADIRIVANTGIDLENQWHEIEITGYEDIINIHLDGKLYVAYEDEAPVLVGDVAFETLGESVCLIDDVEIRESSWEEVVAEPTPEQVSGSSFVPDITHSGHLIIEGEDTQIIEDVKYFQQGNIYVNDEARLVIRNSQLMIGPGELVPTVHCYIFVDDKASLVIENSTIFPQRGLLVIRTSGRVNITNSPTEIHLLEIGGGAEIVIIDSEVVGPIGGLVQVHGGNTRIVNSTIGALALTVPADAHLDISGLESGVYLESWDVHDMIPEAYYTLILEKTRILKDDFTGELKHGPYERGWLFFLDPNAHVRISDSELRKVFIHLENEDVKFDNLRVGIPSSLEYWDIELKDIIIMGQWPFTIIDSNVTISNSDYLFLQPTGQSTVSLVNSHMCEFIPRDFFGTMIFENSTWTTAGEIIGSTPYHSMENNFTIEGSLKIDETVRKSLRWEDAQVTREYEVIVRDESDNLIEGALIKIDGETFLTDNDGKAKFSLIFDEFNYNEPQELEVWEGENLIAQREIDFFTETPIITIIED